VTSAGRASAACGAPSYAAVVGAISEASALGAGRCARARKGESARPRTEISNDVALEMSPSMRTRCGADAAGDRMRSPDPDPTPAGDRMRPRTRPRSAIGCGPGPDADPGR